MDSIQSQNQTIADPGLVDLLAIHKKDIMLSVNCHAVAKVQSFDPISQTITATINYQKTYFQRNSQGSSLPTQIDYPLLVDVPIYTPGGGDAYLTMPIQQGDDCIILFNDRNLDNWLHSGQKGPVATFRMHSFSDGMALIGIKNFHAPIQNYDPNRAVLRKGPNGETGVGVGDDKVKIYNTDTTLNTLLQDLIAAIKGITTSNAVVGSPCTISPASQMALANIATEIEGLLE